MLKSVFYVSEKTNPWPDDGADVQAIIGVARLRNAALDVTGALISTSIHFAQILEGSTSAVDEVMDSIVRDPRHRDVRVLQDARRQVRWFGRWSLAYAGRPANIARHLDALLAGKLTDAREIDSLLLMIRAMERPAAWDIPRRT